MANYQNQIKQLLDSVHVNLNQIQALGPSEALDIANAKASVEQAKQTVLRDIDNMYDINNKVHTDTEQITQRAKALSESSHEAREERSELQKEVHKNKQLLEVRKAQAAELNEKYASNNHSSWLGLWRPLSSEGQSGLIFASIIFGVIAAVSLFFLIRNYIPASLPKASVQGFFGGKRGWAN